MERERVNWRLVSLELSCIATSFLHLVVPNREQDEGNEPKGRKQIVARAGVILPWIVRPGNVIVPGNQQIVEAKYR